jgi:serine/threonine protein kinase/tetratricopeptide (TPR) repeat protein
MANNLSNLETHLAAAVEIEDRAERDAYLLRACEDDSRQLAELQSMVLDYFAAGSLIDRPAILAPTLQLDGQPEVGTCIGPYKLRELLGEGGMGSVYVAEQEKPVRRKVALKVIKPGMDSRQVIARFEAERQALALMDHTNIARVLDAGTTDGGRPYFVMELVKGLPITEHCDNADLTTRERLELFLQVCRAVQHAHQKGVIHRDLKPSNVLVAMHDTVPVVKVIDFGVAKAIGQQLTDCTLYTGFAQLLGTPLYMSPEQAGQSSLDIDTRSDIYSLGVLLYELLTGTTPFDGETLRQAGVEEMRRLIREVDPPRPSARVSTLQAAGLSTISQRRQIQPQQLSRQLRGELDWIVMTALEKDRTRRYETVSGFAEDIRRYLVDEPVVACPPSVAYKLCKFARRNTTVLATTATIALALLVGILLAGWQAIDAKAARRRADENLVLAQQRLVGEKQARAEAEVERKRAEANYLKTREAVQKMLIEVADTRVALIPEMKDVRRRLLEDAVAFYTELIELSPRDAKSYLERGQVHAMLIQYDQARVDYEKAVALAPNTAYFHSTLAVFLNACPDVAYRDEHRGMLHAKRAVELRPSAIAYRQTLARAYEVLGFHKDAVMELEKSVELAPDSAAAYRNLAEAFWIAGKPHLALPHQQKAIELLPGDVWLYHRLAEIYGRLGDDEKALDAVNKGLELHPNPMDTKVFNFYVTRGDIYARRKMYATALADYDKSVELGPYRSFTYKLRAATHFQLKNYDEALADLDTALKLKPDDLSTVWWISADQTAKCPSAEFREGMRRLADRAVELNDRSSRALFERAILLKSLGDLQQARRDLDASLDIQEKMAAENLDDPAHRTSLARTLNNLAWLLATSPQNELRDANRAVELAKRAVDLEADEGSYWNTLGVAQYRAEDWQAALESLTKSLGLHGTGDSCNWYFLAMANQRLDHPAEAREWYDKAVAWMEEHRPDDDELLRFRAEATELLGLATNDSQ